MTKLFSTIFGMGVMAAAVLTSCDSLEPDLQKPAAEITQKEVHAPAASSTIIDLTSKVAANQKVKLVVTRQTKRGSLTSLGKGLLQYSPNKNTRRDSFGYTVFSEQNKILSEDSVVIILEPDTTSLPCGVYLQEDNAHVNTDSIGAGYSVTVNALANDMICGYDSTDLEISILQVDSGGVQLFHGTAAVTGNKVVYTPNASFQSSDVIYYIVKTKSSQVIIGYGRIYIQGFNQNSCTFTLADDTFEIFEDSTGFVTTFLPVLDNDVLCDTAFSAYSYNLVHVTGGTATIDYNGIIYTPDSFPTGEVHYDTLIYSVCHSDECKRANVLVRNKN